ncbi:MAG: DUF4258 domain-containing protein [Anaerolineae bacterium]|nr:DUF4258 domain-containing protein [Anaerolineae bacterium]
MRRLTFRVHAIQKMFARGISRDDVRHVVDNGEVIREYPDDRPYASRLILGWCESRPIHVVAADNTDEDETIIITAYEPDPAIWTPDFKRKRGLDT